MGLVCNYLLPVALLSIYVVSMTYNTGYGLVTPALEASCVFERRGKLASQLSQIYVTELDVTAIRESARLQYDLIWVNASSSHTYDVNGMGEFVNGTKLSDNYVIEYRLGDSYGRIEFDTAVSVQVINVYFKVEIAKDGSFNITEWPKNYAGGHYKIYGRLDYKLWDKACSATHAYSVGVISLYACIVGAIILSFILSALISKARSDNFTALRFITSVIEQPVFGIAHRVRSPIIFKTGQEFCQLGTENEGHRHSSKFPNLGKLNGINFPDYRCIILPAGECPSEKQGFPCSPTDPKKQNGEVDLEAQQGAGEQTLGQCSTDLEKNESFQPQYRALFQKNKNFNGPELPEIVNLNMIVAEKIKSYLFLVNLDENYTVVEEEKGTFYFMRLDKLMRLMMEDKSKELRMIPAEKPFVVFSQKLGHTHTFLRTNSQAVLDGID